MQTEGYSGLFNCLKVEVQMTVLKKQIHVLCSLVWEGYSFQKRKASEDFTHLIWSSLQMSYSP